MHVCPGGQLPRHAGKRPPHESSVLVVVVAVVVVVEEDGRVGSVVEVVVVTVGHGLDAHVPAP